MAQGTPLRHNWAVVALLFGFMLINFADKIVVGLAGMPIMHELGLTPQQFGLVGSNFFLLFSISAIPVGWIFVEKPWTWVSRTSAYSSPAARKASAVPWLTPL